MESRSIASIPQAYQLTDKIYVGPHPGERTIDATGRRLIELTIKGVNTYINLTEKKEYQALSQRGICLDYTSMEFYHVVPHNMRMLQFPIPDLTPPTPAQARTILAAIDSEVRKGRIIYMHCKAGRGRAGCIAGLYLVQFCGVDGEYALEMIDELRGLEVQTEEQRRMVRTWSNTYNF